MNGIKIGYCIFTDCAIFLNEDEIIKLKPTHIEHISSMNVAYQLCKEQHTAKILFKTPCLFVNLHH